MTTGLNMGGILVILCEARSCTQLCVPSDSGYSMVPWTLRVRRGSDGSPVLGLGCGASLHLALMLGVWARITLRVLWFCTNTLASLKLPWF